MLKTKCSNFYHESNGRSTARKSNNASTVFGVFVNAIYQPSMIGRIIQQEFNRWNFISFPWKLFIFPSDCISILCSSCPLSAHYFDPAPLVLPPLVPFKQGVVLFLRARKPTWQTAPAVVWAIPPLGFLDSLVWCSVSVSWLQSLCILSKPRKRDD